MGINTPRKKVVLVVLVVIIITAVLLFVLSKDKETYEPEYKTDTTAQVNQELVNLTYTDTDKDGLLDWEETLWGSNPEMPDTDGDGTGDKEEVAAKRDPTKMGPNDFISESTEITEKEDSKPETLTSQLALEAMNNYDRLQTGSGFEALRSGSLNYSLDKVLSQTKVVVFDLDDISIIAGNDQNYRNWGASVGAIIKKYNYYTTQNEPELLKSLLETRDKSNAVALKEAAQTYQLITGELQALPVPAELASLHISLMNSYGGMGNAVSQMSEALSDPVLAMGGLKNATIFNRQIVNTLSSLTAPIQR